MATEDNLDPALGSVAGSGEAAGELQQFGIASDRRTFLKGAALGTAAAAMYAGGRMAFGPLTAYADNLSGLNCTANDVRIVGPGIVINEPCTCTGTFNASVRFRVINNTGTTRYCVTAHLCPASLPGGGTFSPGDILIGDIPPKSDAFYTVSIPNYPCNSGLVCFGACGAGTDPDTGLPDCSFAKGEDCPTGQCCTTVSWDVNPGCPTRVISSKCRHQQVCIQSFGITATCATSACAARSLTNNCCTVDCGASLNVKIAVSGQTGTPCTTAPAISVKRPGETTFTTVTLNNSGCYVDSSPVAGTYTFRATDCHGCSRDTTLAVCVAAIQVAAPIEDSDPCNGKTVFKAGAVTGGTGTTTFSFSLDGGAFVAGVGTNGDQFVYSPSLATGGGLDTSCHSLVVKANRGGCEATSSATTFSQCISTAINQCTRP